jgi:hypothetical protein
VRGKGIGSVRTHRIDVLEPDKTWSDIWINKAMKEAETLILYDFIIYI